MAIHHHHAFSDRPEDIHRVTLHEDHVRRLHRDVRSCADRDADVGLGQRRRVVDAVADHPDDATFAL